MALEQIFECPKTLGSLRVGPLEYLLEGHLWQGRFASYVLDDSFVGMCPFIRK